MTPAAEARALVRRYLDPRARWSADDDSHARSLRDDPDARRTWASAIAMHRALVGATELPSGIEQRRQRELAIAAPHRPPVDRTWWSWWVPVASLATALAIAIPATSATDRDGWIRARGISGFESLPAQVGIGIGGVTEDGREYELIADAAYVDDWLRFSYTNERADLTWLYVFALQPNASTLKPIPVAPLPGEDQSLPIHTGRFVALDFETRLAARHALGPVRIVALFTVAPIAMRAVDALSLDPDTMHALPSELEARLRAGLGLPPESVVQVLDTRIAPGSATLPGARQETP